MLLCLLFVGFLMSRVCVDCGGTATRELRTEFPVCRPCWASWLAVYAREVF